MNALLIHNDNLPTSLINGFKNPLKFDIGQAKILEFDFSFDQEAHNQLNSTLENGSFDVIFIPYSLSPNNYLELSGLRLALHIRLTVNWRHRYVPIVFIGHETKEQIAKLTDYGSFLFSSGIFSTTKFEYNLLEEQFNWIKNNWKSGSQSLLSNSEYDSFLSRIKIKPSASHQSHHSLVNEWALYRWAKALGNLGDNAEELGLIDRNVSTDLYFKYLIAIHKITPIDIGKKPELKIKSKGNVLLIDDEANKGWYEIFCTLLCDNNPDMIDLHYIDDQLFHHKSQEEIISLSKKEIKKITELPDVILLDLRIHSSDFTAESIYVMTGYKLLKEIKKINPGIQVIIFSATNKAWNLQALQKAGADGFIMKESPETSLIDGSTLQSMEIMINTINLSLERSFLKDFYNRLEELSEILIPRKNFKKSPKPLPKEFVDEVLKWMELSCDVLSRDLREVNITSSFLFMFSILENLANRVIDVDNPREIITSSNSNSSKKFEFEFRENNQKLKFFKENESLSQYEKTQYNLQSNRSLPWTGKILNTLDFINNGELPDTILSEIITKRNDLVHANSTTGNVIEISIDMLETLNEILYKGLKSL